MRRVALALVLVVAALAAARWLYDSGWLRPNQWIAERYAVHGIDVSHHQGVIDWSAVAADGVEFAYIKATEGADWHDPRFATNWRGATDAGIRRGAYHFFTFCTPGAPQAEHFLSALETAHGELPPAADVEFTGNCTRWDSLETIRAELAIFLERIEAGTGRRPILYLPRAAHDQIVGGYFPDHELWVRSVLLAPSRRRYGDWLFWQFSQDGRVAGIQRPVDRNVFRESAAEFERRFPRVVEPVP